MRSSTLERFKPFEIEPNALLSLKGGLCACKQAAPYSCATGGYVVGTVQFNNCMQEIYDGCNVLDPSCHEQ